MSVTGSIWGHGMTFCVFPGNVDDNQSTLWFHCRRIFAKCHAMTPDGPRGTRNLCFKTFLTHPRSQLLALWKERSSNRRSQQRLSRSKKVRSWSLWRSLRHEINKFRDALMRKNVAYDIMKNKCHDGNVSNACPRSQCTRAHHSSMARRQSEAHIPHSYS